MMGLLNRPLYGLSVLLDGTNYDVDVQGSFGDQGDRAALLFIVLGHVRVLDTRKETWRGQQG